ncbi:MAG: DUF402 domain-containing protein [Clostridiales bacterium]|nr:DUF402 domain-containing protein [Clostridiales bacterium]
MDTRSIDRPDWSRILKRTMHRRPICVDGHEGLAHILIMDEIIEPLVKNGITIVSKDMTWLQIALRDTRYWLTAMFDEDNRLVQIYFDITAAVHFDDPQVPTFEDMYLDLVLYPDGHYMVLDEDELAQALKAGEITEEAALAARQDLEKLIDFLRCHAQEVMRFCTREMIRLKSEALHTEFREALTRDGVSKGIIRDKHGKREEGEYFRHVILVLKTEDSPAPGVEEGRYISQQRSLKARHFPGKWDVTGGGVLAFETLEEAGAREAKEELGLDIDPAALKPFYTYYADWDDGTGLILTMFGCRVAVPAEGFHWDEREVNDVCVVPLSVFLEQVRDHNDDDFCDAIRRIDAAI